MYRIGLHVYPSAPFWVEVNQAILQQLGDKVVTVESQDPFSALSEHDDGGFAHLQGGLINAGWARPV